MKILQVFLPIAFGLPALELKKQRIGFKWNVKNNCGPRPNGPIYPHPPLNTNHNPQMPMHCDMIDDDLYLQGYSCNTTCQAAPEIQVEVECDCLKRIGFLTLPIPCKWITKTMEGEKTECPEVPESLPHYDWRCDPRNETCPEGQYGEPIISDYKEYIPPPPLEEGDESPFVVKRKKDTDEGDEDDEDSDEEGNGSGSGDASGDGSDDEDEKSMTDEVLESVDILKTMLKKEAEAIKAAEHMKKDYEKLVHDKKVEEILYESLGWKPPPTKKPAAKIVAVWNPGSIFGSEPNSTIVGGDDVFTTQAVNVTTTSTTTTTTTTTTSTVETIDIDYETLLEPTQPATTVTATTVRITTTVKDEIIELEDNDVIQDHDDRFDFDESLFANDFVEPVYDVEEEEEEIERSPKVTKVSEMSVQRNIVDENQQLDLASLGLQNEKAVTINIFNNQVYNQNASDGARLVNNHGQDLTFGDKIGQGGVIPPGANMGARGQLRTMQHMVEQLVHGGSDDNLMRELENGHEFYQEQAQLMDKILSLAKQLR